MSMLTGRACALLDHDTCIKQLAALQRKPLSSGVDRIDHPANGHDDVCNSVALVLTAISEDNGGYDWAYYGREGSRNHELRMHYGDYSASYDSAPVADSAAALGRLSPVGIMPIPREPANAHLHNRGGATTAAGFAQAQREGVAFMPHELGFVPQPSEQKRASWEAQPDVEKA